MDVQDTTSRPDHDLGNSSLPRFPLVPLIPLDRAGTLAQAAAADTLRQVTTLLELLDAMLGDEQVTLRAKTYRTFQRDPYQARQAAEAFQACRVSALLAGVLSDKAGGVSVDAVRWGIERARAQLEPKAEVGEAS